MHLLETGMSASLKTQLSLLIPFLALVIAMGGEGGRDGPAILLFFSGPLLIYSLADFFLRYLSGDSNFWGWRSWVIISSILLTIATLITMQRSCNYACAYPLYFMVLASYFASVISLLVILVLFLKKA